MYAPILLLASLTAILLSPAQLVLALSQEATDLLGYTYATEQLGWNPAVDFCNWPGVQCGATDGQPCVVKLQLQTASGDMLRGSLPDSWGRLTCLRVLNVSGNNFTGSLPQTYAALVNLTIMDLSNNSLQGELPATWAAMSKLQVLHLGGNKLSGELPRSWSQLSKLVVVTLSNNSFVGSLPSSWTFANTSEAASSQPSTAATPIPTLDLSHNCFTGPLPGNWTSWAGLQVLTLSDNRLTGSVPPSWCSLPELTELRMDINKFSGLLPPCWGPKVSTLDISYNNFRGSLVDAWVSSSSQLFSIAISKNLLTGTLPESWGAFKHLTNVNLGFNKLSGPLLDWDTTFGNDQVTGEFNVTANSLTGTLPAAWSQWKSIIQIDCSGNQLTGWLPPSWGANQHLRVLHVDHNQLSGPLPDAWSTSSLLCHNMEANNFAGTLPASWAARQTIQALNLIGSKLTGTLPAVWSNITSLKLLWLAGNSLTGPLPDSWGSLHNLLALDLSANKLVGTIPPSWAQLSKLKQFNLQRNQLEGSCFDSVPNSVWYLDFSSNNCSGSITRQPLPSRLLFLDLSYNQFSGSLPAQLPATLAVLNVSSNQFTGSLPAPWGMSSGVVLLQLDNNALTGQLPAPWARIGINTGNSLQLSMMGNSLTGKVPKAWVNQFCLNGYMSANTAGRAGVIYVPVVVSYTVESFSTAGVRYETKSLTWGSPIVLPVNRAEMRLTLHERVQRFSYAEVDSLCGIPEAHRVVAVLWATFGILLLVGIAALCLKLRPKKSGPAVAAQKANAALTERVGNPTELPNAKGVFAGERWESLSRAGRALAFVLCDVLFFVYSQVTDILVVHKLFSIGRARFGWMLLAIFLLQYPIMWAMVLPCSLELIAGNMRAAGWGSAALARFVGVLCAPVVYFLMHVRLGMHSLLVPVPEALERGLVDDGAFYQLATVVEVATNALPQLILQTWFYLLGNDPHRGMGLYISTQQYVLSAIGSVGSITKTVLVTTYMARSARLSLRDTAVRLVNMRPLAPSARDMDESIKLVGLPRNSLSSRSSGAGYSTRLGIRSESSEL